VTVTTHYLRVGNRLPKLRRQLVDGEGAAINLAASTVAFRMWPQTGGALKVANAECQIIDAATGVVEYAWAALDVDTAGTYLGEFEITLAGLGQTVPADPRNNVVVVISKKLPF